MNATFPSPTRARTAHPADGQLAQALDLASYARRDLKSKVLVFASTFERLTPSDAARIHAASKTFASDVVILAVSSPPGIELEPFELRAHLAALVAKRSYCTAVEYDGSEAGLAEIVQAVRPDQVVRLTGGLAASPTDYAIAATGS